ncbi:hypothetical protein ACCO45_012770 [Purpureocillium lilacinum]|uniref:Uncharacterized protein n=1 Tax=Purpureocillium lilacinum TaxID=33203 RepID=A0ACC4D9K1_PURLI
MEKPFRCPECWRGFGRRDLLRRHHQKMHESTSGALPSRRRICKDGEAGIVTGTNLAVGSLCASTNAVTYVEAVPKTAPASTSVEYGVIDHSCCRPYVDFLCPTAERVQIDMSAAHTRGGISGAPPGLPELETLDRVFDGFDAIMQTAGLLLPTCNPLFGLLCSAWRGRYSCPMRQPILCFSLQH